MKKLIVLTYILLVIMFIGCAGKDNEQNSLQDNQGNEESSVVTEAVQQEELPEEEEELVLSFVGDVMFDRSVAAFIKSKGADYIFEGYEKHFRASDIVFANLETSVCSRGEPEEEKEYTFRSSPKLVPFLKKYNFLAVSIANNHAMDYGREAFREGLGILKENGIAYGGGGYSKKEALEGAVIEKKGLRIGFIAFTGVVPSVDWYAGKNRSGIIGGYKVHEPEVLEAVSSLKERCDILVVSMHWGKEGQTEPRQQEKELAHKLVDAGADVVMGHHPHVVQSAELYDDRLILYSLGNFIFTTSYARISNNTIMATAHFDKNGKLKKTEAVPGIINSGRPVPMDELQGKEFVDYLNKQNINIELQHKL